MWGSQPPEPQNNYSARSGESSGRKLIRSRGGGKYREDASQDEELCFLGLVLVVEFFLRLKFLLVQVKSVKRGDDLFALWLPVWELWRLQNSNIGDQSFYFNLSRLLNKMLMTRHFLFFQQWVRWDIALTTKFVFNNQFPDVCSGSDSSSDSDSSQHSKKSAKSQVESENW